MTEPQQLSSSVRSLPESGKLNPPSDPVWMSLRDYRPTGFSPGRSILTRTLWYFTSELLFETGWFPSSALKCWILRLFGAQIGQGVVIKPRVRIKFPWKLNVGPHCWIGEQVWIDNLAPVTIGHDSCLSQGVYLCTGSHDHRQPGFDLIVKPITLSDQVWLAARCTLLPGVTVGRAAVVAAGSVVASDVLEATVVGGCPAKQFSERPPRQQMVVNP